MKLPMASSLAAPSYSRLATLHGCRRKYYYRYVLGLRSPRDATRALAGKALHAGLDILYRRGYDAIEDAHRAVIATMEGHVAAAGFEYLTAEHLMGLLVQYVQRWPEDDDAFRPLRLRPSDLGSALVAFEGETDAEGYMVFAESPMQVRLDDGNIYTLVIDLVVDTPDGIFVVDHKATAGYLGDRFSSKFVLSPQPRAYVLATQALLGECAGAIINGIHMGPNANKAESRAVRFDRYTFDYNDGELREALEWLRVTQALAQQEEGDERALLESAWPINPDAYHAECDYLPLCEVSAAMRPARMKQYNTEDAVA